MYSALTYDVMKFYLTLCKARKFVMAILHWKQGLLCDKKSFTEYMNDKEGIPFSCLDNFFLLTRSIYR